MKTKVFWLLGLLLGTFLARVLPHPANLSPVVALSLIATRTLNPFVATVSVLMAVVLSDLVLGFDSSQFYIYVALGFSAWLGYRTKSVVEPLKLGATSLAASSVFYVISNFGHWMTTAMYPKTAMGLIECYVNAIPFFWRSLAADFFFFGVLLLLSQVVLGRARHDSLKKAA